MVQQLRLPDSGRLVDLGCSDGFVAAHLLESQVLPAGWEIAGYDRNRRLVRVASARGLARAQFREIDLNDGATRIDRPGDLVICLETLEHVGSYRDALAVIHHAWRPAASCCCRCPTRWASSGSAS